MPKLPHNFEELLCKTSANKKASKLWIRLKQNEYQEEAASHLRRNTKIMMEHWPQNGTFTPLHRCAGNDIYWLLLQTILTVLKIDPNIVDHDGDTALNRAASQGQLQSMNLLLQAGATTHNKNKLGNTAMHRAAMSGMEKAITLLNSDAIANTTTENEAGHTPFICAVRKGHVQVVKLLLQNSSERERVKAIHHVISIPNNNMPGTDVNTMFGILLSHSSLHDLDAHTYNGMSVCDRVAFLDIPAFQNKVKTRRNQLLARKLHCKKTPCDKSHHSKHRIKEYNAKSKCKLAEMNSKTKPTEIATKPAANSSSHQTKKSKNSTSNWSVKQSCLVPIDDDNADLSQDTHLASLKSFRNSTRDFPIQSSIVTSSLPQHTTNTHHSHIDGQLMVIKDIWALNLHLHIGPKSTNNIVVHHCENVHIESDVT
ncbi:uncharacterized protein LOC134180278 [Corticium candelabrum]|uniref:uncharacterized protein LOC134180278 n=1 Tax=Corticium candelabrum TaxID=121492 RepID=UPI002E26EB98|nr:uncharacterized protein LOC134180278 [Corticium candelabrum]